MKHLMTAIVLAGVLAVPTLASDEDFELLEQKVVALAADGARITAMQAIAAAVKEAPGATPVEVSLYLEGKRPVFGLDLMGGDGEMEIVVDAVSGEVLDTENDDEDEQENNALDASKVSLTRAVESALNTAPGAAVVEAEAEFEDGNLGYEVTLLIGGVFKEVALDADGVVREIEQEHPDGDAWIFDHDAAEQPPAGWRFGYTHRADSDAVWSVREDPEAFSGTNVLEVKADSAGHSFNVAMAAGTSYKDVNVRTRIRPISGKEDQGGGVIWRCKDASNYYVCRINPLENNFRVYKVVKGRRREIGSSRVKTPARKWYVVRAEMVGDHITCFVDGEKKLDVHDGTFTDAGMVGLWTKADASSSFDNVAAQGAGVSDEHDDD